MKVMILGGGGREHTLAWKISQSPEVEEVASLPGNPGLSRYGPCLKGDPGNPTEVAALAREQGVDLVVVGPEAPLVVGVVDALEAEGILAFGPNREAAQLEGSKIYAKETMLEGDVPTADYVVFDDVMEAKKYVESRGCGLVVKADGLAAGKGAFVCDTAEETLQVIERLLVDRILGEAGDRILVEERLSGQEASVLALCDGKDFLTLEAAQDHKRAFDGDQGPNTGGMGAYSPTPIVSEAMKSEVADKVIRPTLDVMSARGCPFRGVLYAGLMLTDEGLSVLEFNVRFGDPEAQVIVPRMSSDLIPVLCACARRELGGANVEWSSKEALCVVMASGGYPGSYEKGFVIRGLEDAEGMEDVVVFQAGTALKGEKLISQGGRVLGVTGLGRSLAVAQDRAYQAVDRIRWEGAFCRRDIGWQAL